MEITYIITYHSLVVRDDIPKIDTKHKNSVQRAIGERLATKPDQYGKPLRYPIKGYWKLRVGDYRIVFKIKKENVIIVAIRHRSVVNGEVQKRI